MSPQNIVKSGRESPMLWWEEARRRLVPVIGESGFRILFARSLHLARREAPWLAVASPATDEPFDDLRSSLARESQERALEAERALRAEFIDLLHTLVGEGLTSRLLDPLPVP